MLEKVNIRSRVPLYDQIVNHVRFAVSSGRLKPGEKLPSAKELAEELGINLNTVTKAYRDLQVLGLVLARQGMGVYISMDAVARCKEGCRQSIIERFHEVIAEAKCAGMTSQEIKQVLAKCLESDAGPYEDTPAGILALAKGKGK